jgi:macrolide transport system ATP-binding/permease protein
MKLLFRKLVWLFQRRRKEAELQEELQFHLDEEADERRTEEMPAEAARRIARLELGNIGRITEDARAVWGWTLLEQLIQDTRYALRTMARNKAFSALVVLSLALGIGANTAIFSFLDSILLRSLPVADPGSLVVLNTHTRHDSFHGTNTHDNDYRVPNGGYVGGIFAYPAFELFQKNDSVFSSVFGYQGAGDVTVTAKGQADRAETEYVSGDYFRGLGVAAVAGRPIAEEDDRPGAPAVAVVSYGWSEAHFGKPENAAGQPIRINNIPFTIIGVTPPQFFGADPNTTPDLYVPMHANLLLKAGDRFFPPARWYVDPNFDWVIVMARLRPGISAIQAQAALAGTFDAWEHSREGSDAKTDPRTLLVNDGGQGLGGLRRAYTRPLYILLVLVALILAIVCANIANLMLSRATARKREMAVRLSMGAGRFRVMRQLLTESILLAALGGGLGIAVAGWGIRALTVLIGNGSDKFTLHAELNWHVMAIAAVLSTMTGVFFGLAPALQSTRISLLSGLKESRTGERRIFSRLKLSSVLVIAQIAIICVILAAAGLFIRTLSNLESIQLGFNRERLLTFGVDARQAGHRDSEIGGFYSDLRGRFAAIPGVRSATLSQTPLVGGGTTAMGVAISGSETKPRRLLTVGANFFSTMQIPLRQGREIDEHDHAGSPYVAVVDEDFASSAFGAAGALGRHIQLPRACPGCDIEIVGVSETAVYGDDLKGESVFLRQLAPGTIYLPFSQAALGPTGQMVYELRTSGNPLGYVQAVREILRQADAGVPVHDVKTQSARIDQLIGPQILFARLCTAFALLALTIACVGLYGTMSYNVARRTGEIGIRMALGAQRGRVVWMVLRDVLLLIAIALLISLPTTLVAAKLIQSFLFGTRPNDPVALCSAIAIVVSTLTLAGYLPARSAAGVDPLIALRHE